MHIQFGQHDEGLQGPDRGLSRSCRRHGLEIAKFARMDLDPGYLDDVDGVKHETELTIVAWYSTLKIHHEDIFEQVQDHVQVCLFPLGQSRPATKGISVSKSLGILLCPLDVGQHSVNKTIPSNVGDLVSRLRQRRVDIDQCVEAMQEIWRFRYGTEQVPGCFAVDPPELFWCRERDVHVRNPQRSGYVEKIVQLAEEGERGDDRAGEERSH